MRRTVRLQRDRDRQRSIAAPPVTAATIGSTMPGLVLVALAYVLGSGARVSAGSFSEGLSRHIAHEADEVIDPNGRTPHR